jgi:hypothetical protein
VTDPQKISDRWPQIQAAFSSEGVTISLTQAMNVLPKVEAALAGAVVVRPAQPALDLSAARIVNAPDVRGWAETARITKLSFDGSATRVEFTKQDGPNRWPDLTPQAGRPLQYPVAVPASQRRVGGLGVHSDVAGRDGSGSRRSRRALAVPPALVPRHALEPMQSMGRSGPGGRSAFWSPPATRATAWGPCCRNGAMSSSFRHGQRHLHLLTVPRQLHLRA